MKKGVKNAISGSDKEGKIELVVVPEPLQSEIEIDILISKDAMNLQPLEHRRDQTGLEKGLGRENKIQEGAITTDARIPL